MFQVIKKILILSLFLFTLFNWRVSYALDCSKLDDALEAGEAPSLVYVVCPVVRIVNLLIYAVGAILVIIVVIGAIKMAMSLGDPKGFQGALQTWQYAAIGGAIIIGVFAIIFIVNNTLGIDINPFNLPDRIAEYISALLYEMRIVHD